MTQHAAKTALAKVTAISANPQRAAEALQDVAAHLANTADAQLMLDAAEAVSANERFFRRARGAR